MTSDHLAEQIGLACLYSGLTIVNIAVTASKAAVVMWFQSFLEQAPQCRAPLVSHTHEQEGELPWDWH